MWKLIVEWFRDRVNEVLEEESEEEWLDRQW